MPDTVFDEDTLAAASEAMGEEEERPLTFAELGVPGPLVRVLAADDKKTAFPIQPTRFPIRWLGETFLAAVVLDPARRWHFRFRWSLAWVKWMPANMRT